MSKLGAAVRELATRLSDACPTQQLKQLTVEDGQVVLHLTDADDNKIVVNAVFLDPDEYPRSGALVQVDEGSSKCSSRTVEKLSALSERLQDGAQLCAVIARVSHSCSRGRPRWSFQALAAPPCKRGGVP